MVSTAPIGRSAEDLLVLEVFGEVRGGGQVEDNMLVAPGPLGPLGAGLKGDAVTKPGRTCWKNVEVG